jgi:hypothetical protein
MKTKTIDEIELLIKDKLINYIKNNRLKFKTTQKGLFPNKPLCKHLFWGDICLMYSYSPLYNKEGRQWEIRAFNELLSAFNSGKVVCSNDAEIYYIGKYDNNLFEAIADVCWSDETPYRRETIEEVWEIVSKFEKMKIKEHK